MSKMIHEGEIVLKETVGTTPKERLYVNPPGQVGLVVVSSEDTSNVCDWFARIFFPQGYPDSVSEDYLAYQTWDTAQAFCSTIAGILATQEVLRGVGVGDAHATPLAATITWILKDGCGHIGRILFAYSHGSYLDAYSKKWRMYADILNDAAMCIELALPLFKMYATFALCVTTVMKAIVGVAGGATRAALTQHHSLTGGLADVAAKDSAQETAVNLLASVVALVLLTTLGNSTVVFVSLLALHVACNYRAVRAVCLRTLNEPRFLLLIDSYLRLEEIAAPCDINRVEPIFYYHRTSCAPDLKISGFEIKLGQSLKNVLSENTQASHLKKLQEIYKHRNYIVVPDVRSEKMYVLLRREADSADVLCAYLHATLLAVVASAINGEPSAGYCRGEGWFARTCRMLQDAQWTRHDGAGRQPSYRLMRYLDAIVQTQWPRFSKALRQTGWDLSKHLLIIEQWRVCSRDIHTRHISAELPDEARRAASDDKESFEDLEPIREMQESAEANFTIEPDSSNKRVDLKPKH